MCAQVAVLAGAGQVVAGEEAAPPQLLQLTMGTLSLLVSPVSPLVSALSTRKCIIVIAIKINMKV